MKERRPSGASKNLRNGMNKSYDCHGHFLFRDVLGAINLAVLYLCLPLPPKDSLRGGGAFLFYLFSLGPVFLARCFDF
jgi:hypothetical protein